MKKWQIILLITIMICAVGANGFAQNLVSRHYISDIKESELGGLWNKALKTYIGSINSSKRVFYKLSITLIDNSKIEYPLNLIDTSSIGSQSTSDLIVLKIIDKGLVSEIVIIRPSEIKTMQIKS